MSDDLRVILSLLERQSRTLVNWTGSRPIWD